MEGFSKQDIIDAQLTVIITTKSGKVYKGLYLGETNKGEVLPNAQNKVSEDYVSLREFGHKPATDILHVPKSSIEKLEFEL